MATIQRGKVQKEDMLNYDGVNQTGTRVDATGGTVTGLTVDADVDVLEVFGSSTTYTDATISAATTHIGSADATLVFRPGTWAINNDLTVGANFTILVKAGAVFSVLSGKTLTLSGHVIREAATWTAGDGTVTVAAGTTDADLAAVNVSGVASFASQVTFTSPSGAPILLSNIAPAIEINETGQSADEGLWTYFADAAVWSFGPATDAGTVTWAIRCTRSGSTPVLVSFNAPVNVPYLQTAVTTTTALADVTDAINTAAGKVDGAMVFNTTTNKPVWAVGAADADVWVDATGSTAHSPV